ncbi:MAG: lysostaphin resistance A-like protein [Hyphomicrobiaceae bacterium]
MEFDLRQTNFAGSTYRTQTPWLWWQATGFTLLVLAIAMLSAQFVSQGLVKVGIKQHSWVFLIAMAASQLTVICLTWMAAGRLGGSRFALLALRAPAQGKSTYLIAFLAMIIAFALFSAMAWWVWPQQVLADLGFFTGFIRSDAWWLAVLVIALGAPVMEELLFRGFLFPALAQTRIGLPGAAVASSAGWAALHVGYSILGLIEVFAVGLYFSWLLVRTGSLRVPMFCHAAYNLAVVVLLMVVDISAFAAA